MPRVLIRTDTEPPDEFSAAFPQLTAHTHGVSTTLMGEFLNLRDVQTVLNQLDVLGIHVSEVLTVPAP